MGMYSSERKPVVVCGPSRTKQSFRKICNINTLVEKYKTSGLFPNVNRRVPFYGDVSGVKNYHEAMGIVAEARAMFERLPVAVRERFDYDPGKMVAFCEDPANLEEAISKGWAVRRPVEPISTEDGSGGVSAPVGSAEPVSGVGEPSKAS